jgi:hypothetical protein
MQTGDPVDRLSAEDGLLLGDILRQTVRDQIAARNPPKVEATLRRLLAEGHDREKAVELMTAVLAAEMYDMMNEGREFNVAKYILDLHRLPELPYESDA